MSTLRSQLNALASSFAEQVIAAIRGGSLNDLVASGGGTSTGNHRPARKVAGGGGQPDPLSVPPSPKTGKNGRLARRSDDEIAATLNKIVLLVKTQKAGLRAEEIRTKLGLQAKEMPRILKEGLSKKKLSSKGQRRATTYFAK